jgi:outer membrane protein, multidrug efflux system
VKTNLMDTKSLNLNAKDAKRIRKGTHGRPSFATLAQNFATFALKFLRDRSQVKKSIATTMITTFLFGNVVGQKIQKKYERPAVKSPDTFRGGTTPPDPNSIGDLKWFEVFKDPELQKLIQTAFTQNYDLRKAVARIDAERANVGLVRSNEFPIIVATTDLTRTRLSNNGEAVSGTTKVKARTFGDVLLNLLTFEIDIWGRLRQQTKAARAELRASEEDRKGLMTTVVSDVATDYFSLLELDSELDIARHTLATREDSLRIIKIREQGGVASMLDVRQAEELVYQASETVPDTERLISQTENQISLLLGNSPGPILRGPSLTQQQELPSLLAGLPSSLLERRPDIRSAEENLEAQHALVNSARAAFFPRISLTGFFGFQSSSLSNLFTGPGATWNFVPQLAQPIFLAGALKSNLKLAKAQREYALAQYQQSIQVAFKEVSDALVQHQKVKEVRAQQELLVTTLRDRSRLSHLRYEGGVDTLLDTLDADRDLFAAELSLSQTRRNELLSLVQLYKALGGGWQQ